MKDRREFIRDGLATAAAFLSGTAVYGVSQDEEGPECDYYGQPAYSVSVSPDKYHIGNCSGSYDIELEADKDGSSAGMPDELYEESEDLNSSK